MMNSVVADVGHAKPIKFRLYCRLTLMLLSACALISMGIRAVTQQPVDSDNAFTEYTDVLPGHSTVTMAEHGFNCQHKTDYYSTDYATCTLSPKQGSFSQIEVLTSRDQIVQSTFYVTDNRLHFGDLMVAMGVSSIYRLHQDLAFFWQSQFVTVKTSQLKRAAALRPLSSVTFTDVNFQWPQIAITGAS